MKLSPIELRKAQLLMLKIIKEVHRICQKNDIKYYLSDGTLLGAIRHEGFIPWDDDADLGMVRAEYEKFCKIAPQELGEEFILQSNDSDKGFALPFCKIVLKDTVWLEHSAEKTKREFSGIYIDIFPYDKIPVDKKQQKKIKKQFSFVNCLLYIKLRYNLLKNAKGIPRKVVYLLRAFVAFFIPLDTLVNKRNSLCTKYEELSEDFVLTKYGGNFYRNQNPYESFYETELHSFEGDTFYIPKSYDSILRNLYGNYMQLPPENERTNHGVDYFDFGAYKDSK